MQAHQTLDASPGAGIHTVSQCLFKNSHVRVLKEFYWNLRLYCGILSNPIW